MNISSNVFGYAFPMIAIIALATASCTAAEDYFGPGGIRDQLPPLGHSTSVVASGYLGPEAITPSHDGKTLFIALADARQLALFDVAGNKVTRTIALPAEPTALALSQ